MADLLDEQSLPELLRMHREATLGRLLSGLSHDLRNPLNAIQNGAELLQDRGAEEPIRDKLLPVMLRASRRMHSLLSALDMHRPERHGVDPSSLQDIVESCLEVLGYAARGHAIHPYGVESPLYVDVDGAATWQLVVALLEDGLRCEPDNLWIGFESGESSQALIIEHDGVVPLSTTEEAQTNASLHHRLSRTLAEQLGGGLEWVTRDPEGGRVTLTLPNLSPNDEDLVCR